MEWFKHDTDASTDAKIRKLIMRHGAIGYAIYFHCLELIMADVNKDNITFQLEHDAEIIADNLKIQGNGMEAGVDIVNKIMMTIIDLNLFESTSNRITCLKLASRLDSSMTSNGEFRKSITALRVPNNTLSAPNHDTIMTPSCLNHDTIMQEEEEESVYINLESNSESNYKEKKINKKENIPYSPSSYSNVHEPKQDSLSKMIMDSINYWNKDSKDYDGFVSCRWKNITSVPIASELRTVLDNYGIDEIIKAIDNLKFCWKGIDAPFRISSYENFMTKSLGKWIDEAKPRDKFQIKRKYRTSEERRFFTDVIRIGKDDPDWVEEKKQECIKSLEAIGEEFIDYDNN